MNDVSATLFIVLSVVIILLLSVTPWRKSNAPFKAMFIIPFIVGIIVIPYIGHTKANELYQMERGLNGLKDTASVANDSDEEAIKEIIEMEKPLEVQVLNTQSESHNGRKLFSTEIIKINGHTYQVRLVCDLPPLSLTPFETWHINKITKK